MDKKGIIAVSLAIITLVVWQIFYAPKMLPPKPRPAATTETSTATPTPATVAQKASPVVSETKAAATSPGDQVETEKIEKATSPAVDYFFTNLGGGIAKAVLLTHLGENGSKVSLNEFGSVPIGAVSEKPGEGENAAYKVEVNQQSSEVVCERTTPEQMQIVKKFVLPQVAKGKDEYLVKLDISFTNRGTQPRKLDGYYVYVGSSAAVHKHDLPTYTSFGWYHGKLVDTNVTWFSARRIPLIGIQTSPDRATYSEAADNIAWAGVSSQYFTTIVTPIDSKGVSVWARRFQFNFEERATGTIDWARRGGSADQPYAIEGALGMPGFTLAPDQTVHAQFDVFVGPKEYGLLKKLGESQAAILNYGMFKIVSHFLLNSMNWLNSIFHSYAAAIIVLTLCIKTLMWPLQNVATNSMKKMQALQPKMTELREKYKDDPTRMNTELMKLYKDYGVNPFSGCLPMFVQIPIFFGFYSMLGTAIELRNSKFLWVQDLSQPDTVFHLAGIPVNILPLLMAGTMLWQMSLTPKSGDPVQQRVFMFVPLIFIFFCYNFASALALYWTVQNIFSIVQLYLTRNSTAPVLQKVAAPRKKK